MAGEGEWGEGKRGEEAEARRGSCQEGGKEPQTKFTEKGGKKRKEEGEVGVLSL